MNVMFVLMKATTSVRTALSISVLIAAKEFTVILVDHITIQNL